MAQQFQQASNSSGKGSPSPQDILQAMAQQFQQASNSSGKGNPSPQDFLQAMAQQFQQASSSGGRGTPFNASSWGPPGININVNSGWGDGWKAAGPSGRRQAPSGSSSGSRSSSTRPNSSSSGRQRGPLTLALDVVTTDDAYIIYADIPGETDSLEIVLSKAPSLHMMCAVTADCRPRQPATRI